VTGRAVSEERIGLSAHADEETRYRAVPLLDPAVSAEREAIVARLGDASWRVRAAAVDRLAGATDPAPALPALFDRLVGPGGIGEREATALALARIGAPAIAGLEERLQSTDDELRQAAVNVLGAIGSRRAVPALAARLADRDPNVRAAAADALGRTGGAEAVAALIAAVDSDDEVLRTAALPALAALRAAPSVEQLRRLLNARSTRRAAFRLLGFSEDRAALELLAHGLVDPARSVRGAALAALGALRARHTLEELEPVARSLREAAAGLPGAADPLEEGLTSEEPFVPVGAATALGWIGGARQAAALARLAEDDRYRPLVEETLEHLPQSVQVQAALFDLLPSLTPLALITVVAALARAGNAAAFRLLEARLQDPEPQVRAEAIGALSRLAEPRAIPAISAALADEDPTVSVLAASAIVRLAQRDERRRAVALEECRRRLERSPTPSVLRALGAIGDGDDLPRLRGLLAFGDEPLRVAAAAAVAALGVRRVVRAIDVPELARALGDPAWAVRAAAARALAELGRATADGGEAPAVGGEAVEALKGALRDPEPSVQASAAEALGASGRPECATALEELVVGVAVAPVVVLAALHGLERLGAAGEAVVARALRHGDPEVAKEAVAIAGRLPGDAGGALLREAARSDHWDVRHALARAIAERGDASLASFARELAATEPDPLVARALQAAAEGLSGRG
jgi:HEAT repeat protein